MKKQSIFYDPAAQLGKKLQDAAKVAIQLYKLVTIPGDSENTFAHIYAGNIVIVPEKERSEFAKTCGFSKNAKTIKLDSLYFYQYHEYLGSIKTMLEDYGIEPETVFCELRVDRKSAKFVCTNCEPSCPIKDFAENLYKIPGVIKGTMRNSEIGISFDFDISALLRG